MKILALFDYNSFTGFATVSKNLVQNWKQEYGNKMQLDIVAVNYFGDNYSEGDNIRVISAKKKDIVKDDFGRYVFMATLKSSDYDLIFILQDLGVIVPCIKFLKEIQNEKKISGKKQFKSIFYFPVDFALTPNLAVGLEFFDYLATYTEYGKSQVLRLNPKLIKKLDVIPHGNNSQDFYPLPKDETLAFRKEYFGDNSNKFIVTNINRNQSRKDIPTTIFGFLEYWEEYNKNAFLYLHMNWKDPMGWNLKTILSQTPLREGVDYMFPSEENASKGASIELVNKIYNASDMYINTCTGGGWELGITEAMATKLPVLIPNHTSLKEIGGSGKRAYMLDTLYPIVAQVDNIIRLQSDLYEIAEKINLIKEEKDKNSETYQKKVEGAYQYVSSLKWSDIAKKFVKAINRLTKD
ncbi:MAG: glycosyltransferase [Candidatus Kapaibacteriota bacterium]